MRVIKQQVSIPVSSGFDEYNQPEVIAEEETLFFDTQTGEYVTEEAMMELNLLDEIDQKIEYEHSQGKDARYINLARIYLPALRKLFWKHNKSLKELENNKWSYGSMIYGYEISGQSVPSNLIEAKNENASKIRSEQEIIRSIRNLIRTLTLEQTEPIAAIDSNPTLDSYTLQVMPYDGELPEMSFPLEGSAVLAPEQETKLAITDEQFETAAVAIEVAGDILTHWNKAKMNLPRDIKMKLIRLCDSIINDSQGSQKFIALMQDIIQEDRNEEEITRPNPIKVYPRPGKNLLAVDIKSSYTFLYSKASIGKTKEERIKMAQDCDTFIRQAIDATRHMLDFNDDEVEQMYVDIDLVPSVPLLQNETQELNVNIEEVSEMKRFLRRKTKRFKDAVKEHFNLCKAAGMTDSEAEESTLISVNNFDETKDLIDAINRYSSDNQDKAFFVLTLGWLEGSLDKIYAAEYGTMEAYIDLWGDRILDQVWDAKFGTQEPTDEMIWEMTKGWEQQYANMLPVQSKNARRTRAYFLGAISVIGTESDLDEAGMSAWRLETSYPCSRAYNFAYKNPRKDGTKEAWAAFYHTAQVIGASKDKVKVETVLPDGHTGKTEIAEIDWPLFFYRARRMEVFVPKNCPQEAKNWVSQQIKIRNLQDLLPVLKQTW